MFSPTCSCWSLVLLLVRQSHPNGGSLFLASRDVRTMMPLLRRTQPIGRKDLREKATRLQVRHLARHPAPPPSLRIEYGDRQTGTSGSAPLFHSVARAETSWDNKAQEKVLKLLRGTHLRKTAHLLKITLIFVYCVKCKHSLLFCQVIVL